MRYRFLLLAFLIVHFCVAQTIDVMTYNIRLSLESDQSNAWSHRAEELTDLLAFYKPEVFGVQEALPEQMLYLSKSLPNYQYVGVGRDDGANKGEYSAVFYDAEKLTLLKGGTFWLSPTPSIPSKGWDAAYPRICSYGLFKSKVHGKRFWMFNSHFDHIGNVAREESAKLLLKEIQRLNTKNHPVILTGDFNLKPDSIPIALLSRNLKDAFTHSEKKPYGPTGTFTGFDTQSPAKDRIDYIFSKDLRILSYRAVEDRRENLLYPSDHFPVISTLSFK